jgi:hypothetical protein
MRSLVVTTINRPTDALKALAVRFPEWRLIVVGDNKTPSDWSLDNARFLSMGDQKKMPFELAGLLPENHYCRKNLGYLASMSDGAVRIAETDDDNSPTVWPIDSATCSLRDRCISGIDWFNVYELFTNEPIWPRGYPLELLEKSRERAKMPGRQVPVQSASCPVQQYLAEGDPDVDAIYRLTIGKTDHKFVDGTVILDKGTMVPFNSQSTLWFREAYMYMYLPSFVSFRMTDIWRSLIAQVGLWAHGCRLAYHGRGVFQERNAHNLMRDFEDETVGYRRNAEIGQILKGLDLGPDWDESGENLVKCYRTLVKMDVVPAREIPLVEAWIHDVHSSTRN